ncbi:hypothetical protein HYFRA_00007643 [Hymenoscyphus fraxineus]|uniref:Uncharacterized protein n=1 Tax=Hymenoscyphus fraxineus TaxID=746836 RepID=A0A9N9PS08_9HELO|nr:hypothetical protein HYFRA_00007643 [Hymenoscyphus fraxineus]
MESAAPHYGSVLIGSVTKKDKVATVTLLRTTPSNRPIAMKYEISRNSPYMKVHILGYIDALSNTNSSQACWQ